MKVDAYSMLEREVAIMKKVSHQNIVKLYEVMESSEDDKLYLVLEYMDFGSLLSPNFFRKRA
jgi:[calcium/calmodulin-dependent protein kinase] kinase